MAVMTHPILLLHLIGENLNCLIHGAYAALGNFSIHFSTVYFITAVVTVCWRAKPFRFAIVMIIYTELLL